MAALYSAFGVGVEASHLSILQVVLRAIVVFGASIIIVRIADKRFFAKKTAFDIIMGFILGSMLGRAINGSEALGPTIVAGFALAFLHRALGWLSCVSPVWNGLIKGHSQELIAKGRINNAMLKKHHIGKDDLLEELRLNGLENPDEVRLARLERSGEVSVIRK